MKIQLTVTAGPHAGKQFLFDRRDTFLVGRGEDAHFRLTGDDPYLSRRQFVLELNPPRCRVLDLNSRNGITVNGRKVPVAELVDGDRIAAGQTVFQVAVVRDEPDTGSYDWSPAALLTIALPDSVDTGTLAQGSVNNASGFELRPTLAGYTLRDEVGRGGMGVVYRATRDADGSEVAVKMVMPAAAATRKQVELFVREARLLGRLSHPRIVKFLDAGESDGVIYLVMEYVPGTDAGKLLVKKGRLSVKLGVRLICQVLSALTHAHSQGIVHRDVKPSNLLVAGDEKKRSVKLADFGLARVYAASKISGLTMQGEVGGTPAYMAPEQVTHYREAGPAADQYAAAATLYRLLTNEYTHDLPTGAPLQLIHITSQPPTPIAVRRPDLPAGLADAIGRALAREPGDRFPDVNTFQRAILPFGT